MHTCTPQPPPSHPPLPHTPPHLGRLVLVLEQRCLPPSHLPLELVGVVDHPRQAPPACACVRRGTRTAGGGGSSVVGRHGGEGCGASLRGSRCCPMCCPPPPPHPHTRPPSPTPCTHPPTHPPTHPSIHPFTHPHSPQLCPLVLSLCQPPRRGVALSPHRLVQLGLGAQAGLALWVGGLVGGVSGRGWVGGRVGWGAGVCSGWQPFLLPPPAPTHPPPAPTHPPNQPTHPPATRFCRSASAASRRASSCCAAAAAAPAAAASPASRSLARSRSRSACVVACGVWG